MVFGRASFVVSGGGNGDKKTREGEARVDGKVTVWDMSERMDNEEERKKDEKDPR
jgi:hypothetical protein